MVDPVVIASSYYSVGGAGDTVSGFIPNSPVATKKEEEKRLMFASESDIAAAKENSKAIASGEASYNGVHNIEIDGLVFNAAFCSGNLQKVCQVDNSTIKTQEVTTNDTTNKPIPVHTGREYRLWLSEDCKGMECERASRVWFFFSVQNHGSNLGNRVRLVMCNMNRISRMYRSGMRPVYKTISLSTDAQAHGSSRFVDDGQGWNIVPLAPYIRSGQDGVELCIDHDFPEPPLSCKESFLTYFAFCYPYSFAAIQRCLSRAETSVLSSNKVQPGTQDKIYYHRELLVRTLQNRRVDLITITADDASRSDDREVSLDGIFPPEREYADIKKDISNILNNNSSTNGASKLKELKGFHPPPLRPYKFPGKPVVFISARVHPGETPSSFIFDGILNFLIDPTDPRAHILRSHFVFKLIPVLNPDGVSLGHHRTDSMGRDLNRFYKDADPKEHPVVHAVMRVLRQINEPALKNLVQKNDKEISEKESKINTDTDKFPKTIYSNKQSLYMYIDLHAHASKSGMFMFGNHLPTLEKRIETRLFPWLVGHNYSLFEENSCNFSLSRMSNKDKSGFSKAGCGRVCVYHNTSCTRVYTLESNYYSGKNNPNKQYTPSDWRTLGRKCMISLVCMLGVDVSDTDAVQNVNDIDVKQNDKCDNLPKMNKSDNVSLTNIVPNVPKTEDFINIKTMSSALPPIPKAALLLQQAKSELREKLTGIKPTKGSKAKGSQLKAQKKAARRKLEMQKAKSRGASKEEKNWVVTRP